MFLPTYSLTCGQHISHCLSGPFADDPVRYLSVCQSVGTLPQCLPVRLQMIRYLSLCLQRQAAPGRPVSAELVRGRAAGLGAALQSPQLAAPVETFLALMTRLLRASVTDAPLFCLLETVAAAPRRLAPLLADKLDWLKVRRTDRRWWYAGARYLPSSLFTSETGTV